MCLKLAGKAPELDHSCVVFYLRQINTFSSLIYCFFLLLNLSMPQRHFLVWNQQWNLFKVNKKIRRSGVFIVNFKQILHVVLVFPLLTLKKYIWLCSFDFWRFIEIIFAQIFFGNYSLLQLLLKYGGYECFECNVVNVEFKKFLLLFWLFCLFYCFLLACDILVSPKRTKFKNSLAW